MAKMNSNFFEDVYQVVLLIPEGKVTTYGAIGAYLGLKSSARMVGWAMNKTPRDRGIPAHRVVNRNGVLTGKHYFSSPEMMQQKLESEGIEVKEDQIMHFEKVFWNPIKELAL